MGLFSKSPADLRAKADRLIRRGNTERALPLRVKATKIERKAAAALRPKGR
jgi:hypothetical protein